jgi:hypothetical protein
VKAAPQGLPFLHRLDSIAMADSPDLRTVVAIPPTATAEALLNVAQARLTRQVNLLDEMTTLPLGVTVNLEPFACALCAALQEVAHLLDAAAVRMRAQEGDAT